MSADIVFRAHDLTKTYRTGEVEVVALRDVSLEIARGEFVVLLGAFGQRQEHAAEHPGRAGRADQRRGAALPTTGSTAPATPSSRATGASTSASCSSSTT